VESKIGRELRYSANLNLALACAFSQTKMHSNVGKLHTGVAENLAKSSW